MSRRRQNSTRRKPNQTRYKRRCQKRGRKTRKGRLTKQRKKCQRRRGGKSTRKKRSSKKRGKRKWKGKNRRGARNWFGSRGLRPLSLRPGLGINNIPYSGMTKIFVRQRPDLEFVKKFTRPNFPVKEFSTLKTRKSRLFSPTINSKNTSLSVIWPSFG